MNIILCDDNLQQRKELENIINEDLENFNFTIALSTNNPNNVLDYVEKNLNSNNIFIFDINFKNEINGIELARRIRKYDSTCYIIFLTAHIELTLLTFEYKIRALDYIIKGSVSTVKKRIHDCFSQICEDLLNKKEKENSSMIIDTGSEILFIDLSDVLFFETAGIDHKIRIHTLTGSYDFYGTLKECEKKLTSSYYKTHRSYIVNTKKIKCIDKENLIIHMVNDEICYISSRYLKGLIEKSKNIY